LNKHFVIYLRLLLRPDYLKKNPSNFKYSVSVLTNNTLLWYMNSKQVIQTAIHNYFDISLLFAARFGFC